MTITGQIHEITNINGFVSSYALNPKAPQPSTFKHASKIRLHLGSVTEGMPGGFFPAFSVDTTSAADGKFTMQVATSQQAVFSISNQVYFTAYRQVGAFTFGGSTVPILEAIYRSQLFDITKFNAANKLDLYFAPMAMPDKSGISQAQVDDQIKQAKAKFPDLNKLSATISNGKIAVSGSGKGANINFNIELSGSNSFDLTRFLNGKVKAMDIDLPGPDFLVGICISKDDIQKQIEDSIAKLMVSVNAEIQQTLIHQVASSQEQSINLVTEFFKTTASVTFSKLDYKVIDTKMVKVAGTNISIPVPVMAVVPTVSVGFPKIIG